MAMAHRAWASASPTPIRSTAPRRPGRRGTSSPSFSRPLVLGRSFDHPREIFGALAVVRGHQMAKAAVEMAAWDLAARQRGVSLSALLGGEDRASIDSGRLDRDPGFARRARRARRDRARCRLSPCQNQDQAGVGCAGGRTGARRVRRHSADGRRQRRLHARGRAAAGRARSVRPDDDRTAAGLRRHPRPRAPAARSRHGDLPR